MHLNDVQVTATQTLVRTGKSGSVFRYSYTGIFVTRDGALLAVPPGARRSNMSKVGRDTEKKMLRVLFSTNLNPRADPSIAEKCETRDGIRSAFSGLLKAPVVSIHWRGSSSTRSSPGNHRFDCLLLVGASQVHESDREGPSLKSQPQESVVVARA